MRTFLARFKTQHVFIFLVLLGSFLRLYRLRETLQFLGDQGRDALIVRNMLINHHPALIGPVTSVGNMYLGPFYYYFMLFPLMLSYPDPSGPAFAVALVGIATLVLLFKLGKQVVGERATLIATALYAVAPLVIQNVRYSWNPNIVPFFSLLFFYHLFGAYKGKNSQWAWVGLWFSILVQLHYITLILGMFAGLLWIYRLVVQAQQKSVSKSFVVSTLLAIGIFIISLAPLFVFDIRHEYLNSKAFVAFFTGSGEHFQFISAIKKIVVSIVNLWVRNILGLFLLFPTGVAKLGVFVGFAGLIAWIFSEKNRKYMLGENFLLSIFLFSGVVLSLYKSTIYDHYLGFLYPLGALLLGVILSHIWHMRAGRTVAGISVFVLVLMSLLHTPFKENLGYNIDMMRRTSDAIQSHLLPGETYDILLFSDTHDYQGMNYRYFLSTGKNMPAPEEKIHEFKTLFVLDEQNHEHVLDTPQYKIAMWPNRAVIDRFDISGGPKVYELRR